MKKYVLVWLRSSIHLGYKAYFFDDFFLFRLLLRGATTPSVGVFAAILLFADFLAE